MSQPLLNFDTLAEDNIRTLNVPAPTFERPLCVFFVGIPASGKTTLTKKLANRFPFTVFSEEALTGFLAPRATIFKRNSPEVFQLAVKTVEHLIGYGKACIYDANLKTKEQRELLQKVVRDAGGIYMLIYIDCPKEVCYQRAQKHNLEVTRGEAKGFILDKDFFEYEVSSTNLPATDEEYVRYSCQNPEGIFQVVPLIEKRFRQANTK